MKYLEYIEFPQNTYFDTSIKIDNLYYNSSKVKQLILNNVIVHRNLEDISH